MLVLEVQWRNPSQGIPFPLLTRQKLSDGPDGAIQGQEPRVQVAELLKNLIFLNIRSKSTIYHQNRRFSVLQRKYTGIFTDSNISITFAFIWLKKKIK